MALMYCIAGFASSVIRYHNGGVKRKETRSNNITINV